MSPTKSLYPSSSLLVACALLSFGGTASAQIKTEQAKFTPPAFAPGDLFGRNVALSGNRILASSTRRADPYWQPTGALPGEVSILDATTGALVGLLSASNGTARDFFGSSLAVDGQLAVVGAALADGLSVDSGAAYVFDVQTMQELSTLNALDGDVGDSLGASVAIDGTRAIVGAPGDLDFAGSAYLFDGATGTQTQKLTAAVSVPGDWFGRSVALEGSLAAIGALSNSPFHSGSVYVFDSNTGAQLHRLTPAVPVTGERFGTSVEIQSGLIYVGATVQVSRPALTGSVYIFDGATGAQLGQLKPTPASAATQFGRLVAADGSRLAVSAPGSHTGGWASGSVFIFDIPSGQLVTELIRRNPTWVDLLSLAGFGGTGFSVGLDYDAGRVVTGAPTDSADGRWAGAVYVFDDTPLNSGAGACYAGGASQVCPCPGVSGSSGCPNSSFNGATGAILYGSGDAQFANDSLVLHASGLPAGAPGLFAYGASQPAQPLGEGFLCTTGSMRYPVQIANSAGMLERTGLSANASPGQTLTYQFWYRDMSSACGAGNFNLTNSWMVSW